jgi:O-antigen/teichoic acid export membrane protein
MACLTGWRAIWPRCVLPEVTRNNVIAFNRKRLFRGIAASASGLGVRVLLQLAQVPILYLGWDVKQANAWLVLWTLPSYMALTVPSFSSAGGNIAVAAKREGDEASVRAAYRATRIAIVVSNLLMVIGVGLSFPYIVDYSQWDMSHGMVMWTIVWLGVYVVIRMMSATQDLIYRYGEDYGGFGMMEAATTVAELIVMGVVVNLTRNVVVLPAALCVVRMVLAIVLNTQARRRWPEVYGPVDRDLVRQILRRLFKPFLGFVAMPILFAINIQGYSLLVNNYFGPVVFGTFLTMRTMARMADQLFNAVNRTLFFELTYVDFKAERRMALGLSSLTIAALVLGSAGYAAFLLLFGQPIHHLWTVGKIAYSLPILLVFALASLMRAVSDTLFNTLASRNAHSKLSMAYFIASVVGLGLAIVMARSGMNVAWVAGCVNIAEAVCVVVGLVLTARLFDTSVASLIAEMVTGVPQALARVPAMLRQKTS